MECAKRHIKGGVLMTHKVFDIHSHIIPGVDDGSLSLNMSIEMIRNAYEQGVRGIVCTSHDNCNINKYMNGFRDLKRKVKSESIDVSLYCGCEIYCNNYIINNIIDKLNWGDILTINGTRYVLIEFDPYETASVILECVKKIILSGYSPILAHTERYLSLSMNPKYIMALQEYGCLFQVNAYSFVNESNMKIKTFARKLLSKNIISFIGSDAHRTNHRPYDINNGIDYIYARCSQEYANSICYKNAKEMLDLY
jgi:protein-tyrosine phosphatase